MKLKIIRILGFLAILFSLAPESVARNISKLIPYLDTEEARFVARHEGVRDKKELEEMVSDLRSGNPLKTEIVVSKLTEMHDEEMLVLLLEFCGMYERGLAAIALKDAGGEKSLSKMIEVLNRENEIFTGAIRSNAEMDIMIKELQNSLVVGIERISGVRHEKPGDYSRDSVLAYLTTLETLRIGRIIDPKKAGDGAGSGSKNKTLENTEASVGPTKNREQLKPDYWWFLWVLPATLGAVYLTRLRKS